MVETISARGFAAWALGALFFFYAFVQRVSPSVMVEELMRDFMVGGAVLGSLSAFYFYGYASLQIPVGVLIDRFGPRRLMTTAAAVAGLGSLVLALSPAVEQAYLGRLLIGAGAGFSWVGCMVIIGAHLPARRFGVFVGLAQTAGMVGAMVGQAPLGLAVDGFGWRTALLGLAAAAVVLACGLWFAVPERRRPPGEAPVLGAGLRHAVRNRQTWLNAFIGFTFSAPMLAYSGLWGVPHLQVVRGIDREAAAALTTFMFFGWAVGATAIGAAADWLGRRRVLMIGGASTALVAQVLILYVPTMPVTLLALTMFLAGFGGAAMILTFALARDQNPAWANGAALGIVNMAVVGSGAIFQPLVGVLLDQMWDGTLVAGARVYPHAAYDRALAVLPVAGLCGLIGACLAREAPPRV